MKSKESLVEYLNYYSIIEPDHTFAIDDKGNGFTYLSAWETVLRYAHFLLDCGASDSARILVECNQNVDFLLIKYACELIRAIFIPLEHNAIRETIYDIARETGGEILISDRKELNFMHRISYDDLRRNKEMIMDIEFPCSSDICEILFTTGTTGKPKGVMIQNRANIAIAENIAYGVEMKADNTEIIPLPLSHSHALRSSYANLITGAAVVIADGILNVQGFFDTIVNNNVNAIDLSPTSAMILLRMAKKQLQVCCSSVRYIELGTAALPENVKEELLSLLPKVRMFNFYGSTESGRTCVLEFSRYTKKKCCVGKPTHNSKVFFTDTDGAEITANDEKYGYLASEGEINMLGYWDGKLPDLNKGQTKTVYSKDLGYIDEDGLVHVVGRADDIINCNGIKIAPEEIEQAARQYIGIDDCACIPMEDSQYFQIPKLCIVVNNKKEFSKSDFVAFLTHNIDCNRMPRQIEIVESIPHAANGKICRKKLSESLKNTD